ncbi:MAG: type II toxin-antitoxin system Phd/YefM family antitoxin [Rhodospirillales bacterium]|nr:type II toxin-antitoxin system Phd/YefM family antitoxin [Rhodospirillales bacterium]
MSSIGAFEAKTHFSALLERVAQGEEIIITRHGSPVAKLVPVSKASKKRIGDAVARLKEFSKSQTLGSVSLRELREEGRR